MAGPMTPDPLATEIAGIRERASQITAAHDPAECIADLGGPCSGHDAERLADAVEALQDALHRHQHKLTDSRGDCCAGCLWDWPCPDSGAAARVLLSKENSDDAWD